ncbi:MAG TPA: hypothetical protein DCS28_03770 [Candidatus Moranbacteria bacterium]|nr:hypothetical protein [Candidatus Moranbacteria bacterium]HAT75129.1 hypothetical protein [Candidatus Moranbacteria bacterium]
MYSQKSKNLFFSSNRELLISLAVALLCLFLSVAFPAQNSAQDITKNLFFLILLPMAYIKIILKKNLADFGWNLKNQNIALLWGIIITIFTLTIFYLMLNYTQFKTGYVLDDYIKNNFWLFLVRELIIVNFIVFIFSFFFQGFLLAVFREKFRYWSIALQAGIFFAVLFFTQNFSWQTMPFVLLSITGGVLSYKTKSFFYSYFAGIFAIIILDGYIIYLTK